MRRQEEMRNTESGAGSAEGGRAAGKAKPAGINLAAIKASYRRYAPVYDVVFGNFLGRGRKAAVSLLNECRPQRVLEIGVGTGLSLPQYNSDTRIVGIDLSPEMLDRARARTKRLGLRNVEALEEMDARQTPFPDGSFDAVACMYVLSVTPEPARLLREMRRVCAPGGDIMIVNRFSSTKPIRRLVERAAEPFSDTIGFNLQMSWDTLNTLGDLETVEIRPVPGLAGASIVHIRNVARAQKAAGE